MTTKRGPLTKREFDIITSILYSEESLSQRAIASRLNISAGTINRTMSEMTEKGFLKDGMITSGAMEKLEYYKVKRAIFIAAGFGSRLVPITLNTPKPLIRVHGTRIIETLLDAIVATGIQEIYIVRGYLGTQFDDLLNKYPMIKFIENPIFNEANNISSIECARSLLENAYILESDFYLMNPKIITPYQYDSNYLGIPTEVTDDWCFETQNGVITNVRVGGKNCYKMIGISYWTEEDGKSLEKHIDEVFCAPGGKERYWDEVPLVFHSKEYSLHVRECQEDDIIEIDTFNELKAFDPVYTI